MPEIETGVVNGIFPRRALSIVLEWYMLHKEELQEDWKLAKEHRALHAIAPLE